MEFPHLYSITRPFISPQCFHIFNSLCDSMLLPILGYAKFYRDIPFCPWLLGTEFVEHFYGLARTLLPDFTHAELMKTVQNVMVCQRFLLMDHFREKRPGDESAAGYIMEYDPSPLIPDEAQFARVNLTPQNVTSLIELIAFREASQICRQILNIRVPNPDVKHVKLAPLGTVEMAHKHTATVREAEALNGEPDDNDCDTTSNSSASADDNFMVTPEQAATDAMIYSALCDDY